MENQRRSLLDRNGAERRLEIQIAIVCRGRTDHDFARPCLPTSDEAAPAMFQSDRLVHDDAMEPCRKTIRVTQVVGVSPGAL
ncbi:MAG: hypothetical protein QOF11_479 [Chloroflexota bacterium]|nr:hypothetical protein [Chloroflexota bacterium]